jgi:hypothetical protein
MSGGAGPTGAVRFLDEFVRLKLNKLKNSRVNDNQKSARIFLRVDQLRFRGSTRFAE